METFQRRLHCLPSLWMTEEATYLSCITLRCGTYTPPIGPILSHRHIYIHMLSLHWLSARCIPTPTYLSIILVSLSAPSSLYTHVHLKIVERGSRELFAIIIRVFLDIRLNWQSRARFDGVVGYRICLTHRRSSVRAWVESFCEVH